jgi:hypothetical protein
MLPKRPVPVAVAGLPLAEVAPLLSDAQLNRVLSSGVDPAVPDPVVPANEVWPPVEAPPVLVPVEPLPPAPEPAVPDPFDPLPPVPDPFGLVAVQKSVSVV